MKSSPTDPSLWAEVLAGGVGSRFWPISTPDRPKQLLPLGSERPLIADTVRRVVPLVPIPKVHLPAVEALTDPMRAAVPERTRESLRVEPVPRGTAPVLAWAAHRIARRAPDAVMSSLHADHVIEPDDAFRAVLAGLGHLAASHDRLFTIGIEP